jgi:PAS domain S-box-containing protein
MADPTAHVQIDQNLLLSQLRRRVELEKLVLGITQEFLSNWSRDLDSAIDDALARIGDFVAADRSYLFLRDQDETKVSNTHEWCAPGISAQILNLQQIPIDHFQWIFDHLSEQSSFEVHDVDELGEEHAALRELMAAQSIRSMILVRTRNSQGVLTGFLGLDAVDRLRPWQDEDLYILEVIGNIIATALEQDLVRKELLESEALNRTVLETMPDCMFIFDAEGIISAFSAPPDVIMAVPRNEIVGSSIWPVLPQDKHPEFRAAIQESLESGGHPAVKYSLTIEGRLMHFDGRFIRKNEGQVLAVIRKIGES